MANDDGKNNDGKNDQSHENETVARYASEDVSLAESGTLPAQLEGRSYSSDQGDTSAVTNLMEQRAAEFKQASKTQEAAQQHGEASQDRPQDSLQQSHQQAHQAADTRAYAAEKSDTANLSAIPQDATRTGQERDESQSLDALRQDVQTVANRDQEQEQPRDGQRLDREQSQEQDKEQSQQQSQEKSNEKDKTPGR